MAGSLVAVGAVYYVVQATASDGDLLDLDNIELSQSSLVVATDPDTGAQVEYATLRSSNSHRVWADLEQIPTNLQYAFICTEDKDFYSEPGVNFKRTIGAMINEYLLPIYSSKQGASTLEQQLIKNLTSDKSASGIEGALRKLREIYRALILSRSYSKETILEAYLNTISFTGTIQGVQTAANEYFDKDVSELTLWECASIASITKNPTNYNPYTNPENLINRRNFLLYNMWQQGVISDFFFSYFHVTKVEVMGTSRYTDEQVKEMALQGVFTDNSILAVLLHSRVDVEGVPFVEGFYITRLSHNSICISVREKKAVGCIPYLDSYIYFDRNGIFIESSHTRDELVPFFDGIEVSHVIEGEKLPIKGSSVLTTAVALSTIFQKNDAIPDHIEFDTSYQITLTYGDIRVMLGKDEYLEDKMTRVSAILPKLSGKKGILHLENVNDNSKTITFEQDLGEDGVIEDVDTAAAYENAVANWHGGYDLEGDYTGEGEYDQNGNYVGSRPTEESIAANGSWLGGYMEDGSYTGYGQLDKDGNYVGPNPNETSEDGSEEELEDYSEDYSEDYNNSGYDGYDEEY